MDPCFWQQCLAVCFASLPRDGLIHNLHFGLAALIHVGRYRYLEHAATSCSSQPVPLSHAAGTKMDRDSARDVCKYDSVCKHV